MSGSRRRSLLRQGGGHCRRDARGIGPGRRFGALRGRSSSPIVQRTCATRDCRRTSGGRSAVTPQAVLASGDCPHGSASLWTSGWTMRRRAVRVRSRVEPPNRRTRSTVRSPITRPIEGSECRHDRRDMCGSTCLASRPIELRWSARKPMRDLAGEKGWAIHVSGSIDAASGQCVRGQAHESMSRVRLSAGGSGLRQAHRGCANPEHPRRMRRLVL
jgi:hypothetical protein